MDPGKRKSEQKRSEQQRPEPWTEMVENSAPHKISQAPADGRNPEHFAERRLIPSEARVQVKRRVIQYEPERHCAQGIRGDVSPKCRTAPVGQGDRRSPGLPVDTAPDNLPQNEPREPEGTRRHKGPAPTE